MGVMASNLTTLPPPHSKRVEAWIYTVLNPLIESLRREVFLLEKGNLSWRWYSMKCEYLRPVAEYFDYAHQPNYEDFVGDALNPGFVDLFRQHDETVVRVESKAVEFYERLMRTNLFPDEVMKSLSEYEVAVAASPRSPSLAPMRDDLPKYVAEYLINKTGALPSHYITHAFWEGYQRHFLDLDQGSFASYKERESYKALEQASSELQQISNQLLGGLQSHRSYLCKTFDIPFAPFHVG